jgi:class 3 adenylate cyclase
MVATVLFCDIVSSTEALRELGDRAWRQRLDEFERLAAEHVAATHGELIKTTGDGFLAVFDGPARAIKAATAVRDGALGLGLRIRSGVHTSEIERRGRDVTGIGVHVASRVQGIAAPSAIWTTRTVRDLAAGSGLRFEPRGEHRLAGFEEIWPLYEVVG